MATKDVTTFPDASDCHVEWNGRTLIYPPQMQACFLPVLNGEYKAPKLPDEPAVRTVLDIGAACGAFALWALYRWPGCQVTCVEPDPDMAWYLRQNVPEATIIESAVGWEDGAKYLSLGPEGHRGYNTLHPEETGYRWHDRKIEVPLIGAAKLPPADVVKCDAEGAERSLMYKYQYWDTAWWVILEWHSAILERTCERTMHAEGMRRVYARTQDPEMGEQTWCRTKARVRRRGVWEYRMPDDMERA